ncbi:MAG TPA: helix-turn-helix domain-containing protein [Nanoarchaeota archaeon]|nr:helix-turn-helix domain-containing protein [Nanoarchaeota archaeon]
MSALTTLEKHKLKRFIRTLEQIRGRHTELVSVYIPAGYDLNKIIGHLSQEQGTASNIKDKTTRTHVTDSLERMIRHLRLYKCTPPNGLAVFSGDASEREGKPDIQVWAMEPPQPLNMRLYRCEQYFQLDILKEMMDVKEVFGLVVLDKRECTIGLLKGTQITELDNMTSGVPGKTRAGGQCLAFGTMVQSASGSLLKIEACHNPLAVKSIAMEDYSAKDSPITDKWDVSKSEVYTIVTKYPRIEVQSSKDHVFFVATERGIIEKPAEELKQGDRLIMPEQIKISGKIQAIDSKKYYNSFIILNEGIGFLKKKRAEKKLLQKQLAKNIGVTQTAISVIELGKRNITRQFLERLCKELDVDFLQFLAMYARQYNREVDIRLPQVLDAEFAQFLGYLMGDGSIEEDRITFFEQDKAVAMAFKEKFDSYFNINSTYKFRQSKNYHQLRFTCRPLVRVVKGEFQGLKSGNDSLIPAQVLESENAVVSGFLRGLFDAEGYMSGRLGIGMNNKALMQQVQMLLLRFGILSSLREYDNRRNPYSKNTRFTLEISERQSLTAFSEHIGFTSARKYEKLSALLKSKSGRSNVRQVLAFGTNVRKIIEKAGHNLALFPKVSDFFNNKRSMSKPVFKSSIMDCVEDAVLYEELKKIYNCPLLPVEISSIKVESKQVKMIDISVKNQNFIANCLLVHNSAQRFSRLREEAAKEFFKRIAAVMQDHFLEMKSLKGILIGGPGTTKEDFLNENYLNNQLKLKIIATQDIGYTDETGLRELVEKSQEVLAKEAITEERETMQKFFKILATKPEMVAYGKDEVMNAITLNAADKVLISDAVEDSIANDVEEKAEASGSAVMFISIDTAEGVQLKEIGGIAAFLRYQLV